MWSIVFLLFRVVWIHRTMISDEHSCYCSLPNCALFGIELKSRNGIKVQHGDLYDVKEGNY